MNENETTLLNMIRNSENPDQALLVAVEVIINFLTRRESTELQSSVEIPELV
jgi:hypothetical protein